MSNQDDSKKKSTSEESKVTKPAPKTPLSISLNKTINKNDKTEES